MKISEIILELDQGRRGFLKKLGKSALGVAGMATLGALAPFNKAMAGKFNDRECKYIWMFGYNVMKAHKAGADKDRIMELYHRDLIRSLRADYQYSKSIDKMFEDLIDIAIDSKHITPSEFADLLQDACISKW